VAASEPLTTPAAALDRLAEAGRAALTGEELAHHAGIPVEMARQITRSIGFDGRFEGREFSRLDAELVRQAAHLALRSGLDEAAMLEFARLLNVAIGPLAEAARTTLGGAAPLTSDDGIRTADEALETFEQLILHTWRRRLLRGSTGQARATRDEAVCFVDIVGFTALVERRPDEWLEVLDRFEAVVFDRIAACGGQVIKTVGDGAMFTHDDPAGALRTCGAILHTVAEHDLPPVRVGAAHGPVTAARGDRFGSAVNRASRLTERARPNRALVDEGLVLDGGGPAKRAVPRRLRGIGVVRACSLVAEDLVDPTTVEPHVGRTLIDPPSPPQEPD
jgi:adenylate cyclase